MSYQGSILGLMVLGHRNKNQQRTTAMDHTKTLATSGQEHPNHRPQTSEINHHQSANLKIRIHTILVEESTYHPTQVRDLKLFSLL